MELIYKVKMRDNNNEYTKIFSSYDAIKEFLNIYFDEDSLVKLNIETLIMCDDCKKYDDCWFFLQNQRKIKSYCIDCWDKHKVSIYNFTKFKKEEKYD